MLSDATLICLAMMLIFAGAIRVPMAAAGTRPMTQPTAGTPHR